MPGSPKQPSIHHDCIPCEIELPTLRITYQQLNSHWYGHWIMSTIKVYLGNIMQGKSPLHVSHLYILTHSHFTNESLLSKLKIHQYLKVIYIIKILMYIDRSSTPHLNCKWTMDSIIETNLTFSVWSNFHCKKRSICRENTLTFSPRESRPNLEPPFAMKNQTHFEFIHFETMKTQTHSSWNSKIKVHFIFY